MMTIVMMMIIKSWRNKCKHLNIPSQSAPFINSQIFASSSSTSWLSSTFFFCVGCIIATLWYRSEFFTDFFSIILFPIFVILYCSINIKYKTCPNIDTISKTWRLLIYWNDRRVVSQFNMFFFLFLYMYVCMCVYVDSNT